MGEVCKGQGHGGSLLSRAVMMQGRAEGPISGGAV